ncbi:MAG: transcriptional repressor LexA [Chloroherpetonaceae bacterium]|nr:transcriptional repressor LexA [Chthonomonadaceae bacterium]MDW8206278.1 transcriptional repressor LexA [Chloroherpetonaceae bacterium]
MTRGLTEKQQKILAFLEEYVNEKGYPPSIREIGTAFNISSLRGVTVHLDALERKGMIKRANTSRSITIIGKTGATAPSRYVAFVPLVGTIAAGVPITASQNLEGYVPVPKELVRNAQGAFALRVRGDSMIGAHIMPRDLVIIKPQTTADNGDLVAVLLGDEATVKHIQFTEDGVKLLAANPAYEPIEIRREDSRIIGKVIGLIRDYDGHGY